MQVKDVLNVRWGYLLCAFTLFSATSTVSSFANEVDLNSLKQKIASIKPVVANEREGQGDFDISDSALEQKNEELKKMEQKLLKNASLAALNQDQAPKLIEPKDSAEDFVELEEIPSSLNNKDSTVKQARAQPIGDSLEQRARAGDIEAIAALNAKPEISNSDLPSDDSVSDAEIRTIEIKKKLDKKSAEVTSLSSAKAASDRKLKDAHIKVADLLKELEETRNRLMVAETQVDRLSRIVDEHNRAKVASLSDTTAKPVKAVSSNAAVLNKPTIRHEPESAGDMPVATVVVDKANLRAGPGEQHSVLMEVGKGTRLAVEDRLQDWYRVTTPTGTRAWVSSEVIAFGQDYQSSPTSTVKIRGFDANLEDKAFELIRARPQ